MIFDTLVAIDVSYPIPESSAWLFPPQMTMFDSNGDRVMGMFVNPGSYQIALTVTRGKCRDELSKTITIVGEDQSSPNGRSKINSFVERFEVYPNPVTGPLHVKVALEKTSAITLTVTNIMTSQIVAHQTLAGSEYYETEIDLGSLSAGLYNIRLDYFNGSVQQKLIVR
jgi:PKD repeat protein